MKQKAIKLLSILVALTLITGTVSAMAFGNKTLDAAVTDTAAYMYQTVKSPQVGSIGGEWAVLGLARSGYDVPMEYYQNYYETVVDYVKACKGNLHNKKYTEYSRLIVALSSIGKDPTQVGGYNLLTALGDYDKTIWQGLNGPIWALISLDSGNYEMPQNPAAKTQATRDMYVQRILDCQLPDGGWSLFGGTSAASSGDGISDPDITGMALQALAKYQDRTDVKKATGEALACMSKRQDSNGGFSSWGTTNSESCVQMLVALCELGIPLDDPRFVKKGKTMLDNLMTFYLPGSGFLHTADGSGSNQMASEQGFYGIIAAQRLRDGRPTLYRMTDALSVPSSPEKGLKKGDGLEGKHADIQTQPIVNLGKTFDDITGVYAHKNQPAIESLAARNIISGKDTGLFDPEGTMTRAEFSSIVVKALGLTPKATDTFSDVPADAWFASVVGTAYTYGIVTGIDSTHFTPSGTITRQEAAVMIARAAKLCGMETDYDAAASRDVLAQFSDYVKSADWARSALAFCYQNELLPSSDMEILPRQEMKRCEIAQIVFNLLGSSNLL